MELAGSAAGAPMAGVANWGVESSRVNERPARSPCQVASRSGPAGVTSPRPVIAMADSDTPTGSTDREKSQPHQQDNDDRFEGVAAGRTWSREFHPPLFLGPGDQWETHQQAGSGEGRGDGSELVNRPRGPPSGRNAGEGHPTGREHETAETEWEDPGGPQGRADWEGAEAACRMLASGCFSSRKTRVGTETVCQLADRTCMARW